MTDDEAPVECDECGALIAPGVIARIRHDEFHRYIDANLED